MTEAAPAPVPGFDRPESFEVKTTFKDVLISGIVLVIGMFLISGVFFALILSAIGIPGLAGFLAGFVFAALMVVAKKRQLDEAWKSMSLTISPQGLVVDDPAARLEMPWSGVRAVGQVKSPKPVDLRRTKAAPLASGAGGDIGAAIGQAVITTSTGILGVGTHTLKPDAPALARRQFEQNVGINGVDEETGENLLAVIAQQYGVDWQLGRIGDWVRAYRPDVMPASS